MEAFAFDNDAYQWTEENAAFEPSTSYRVSEATIYKLKQANSRSDANDVGTGVAEERIKVFSTLVHRLFWAAGVLLTVGTGLALFALVAEQHLISVVSAVALGVGMMVAALWLERAENERRQANTS